jgi:hypothetical protein
MWKSFFIIFEKNIKSSQNMETITLPRSPIHYFYLLLTGYYHQNKAKYIEGILAGYHFYPKESSNTYPTNYIQQIASSYKSFKRYTEFISLITKLVGFLIIPLRKHRLYKIFELNNYKNSNTFQSTYRFEEHIFTDEKLQRKLGSYLYKGITFTEIEVNNFLNTLEIPDNFTLRQYALVLGIFGERTLLTNTKLAYLSLAKGTGTSSDACKNALKEFNNFEKGGLNLTDQEREGWINDFRVILRSLGVGVKKDIKSFLQNIPEPNRSTIWFGIMED